MSRQWRDSDHPVPTGTVEQRIGLVHLGRYAKRPEIIAEMDKLNVRPVLSPEFFALTKAHPDLQRKSLYRGQASIYLVASRPHEGAPRPAAEVLVSRPGLDIPCGLYTRRMMRHVQFAEGEYYHIYNRGVEKRAIYSSVRDYERFLYALFVCNDTAAVTNTLHSYRGLASIRGFAKHVRTPLVDVLCFCLMPNHFHFLLRQLGGDSVSRFMQKLGTAYAMYFNTKYERSGSLFQGPYQAIHVPTDQYLLPLSRYIHLNPLSLTEPRWKEIGVRNPLRVHQYLLEYRWSSYQDYVGAARYETLLNKSLLESMFRSPSEYASYVEHWRPRQFSEIATLVPQRRIR